MPVYAAMDPDAPLLLEAYVSQVLHWPRAGRYILAHFDDESVVVYQAFAPLIADFAVKHRRFGAGFSLTRMSWIKSNFLWMMFRSGWASKQGQERILGIRLRRSFFERVLRRAVPSSFVPELHASTEAWQAALRTSEVRLQWDPDHSPSGTPVPRRAIQLGLRGSVLAEYAGPAILEIYDLTSLALDQRPNATPKYERLHTPSERIFVPRDEEACRAVGLDMLSAPTFPLPEEAG